MVIAAQEAKVVAATQTSLEPLILAAVEAERVPLVLAQEVAVALW